MKEQLSELVKAAIGILALSLVLCVLYPLAVWGFAQLFFPAKANGSFIRQHNNIAGSILIGQNFQGPGFFHPRPSAAGRGYDATVSGGSNLGPLAKSLQEQVESRLNAYRRENELLTPGAIPIDAVTASASGLDPHISVANALLQANRVAKARSLSLKKVQALIAASIEPPQLGIFGEERVNVLLLNLELENSR